MRPILFLTAIMLTAQPAIASKKPCRDANGQVVECSKPVPKPERCKDASGKFVPCRGTVTKTTSDAEVSHQH